VSAAAVLTTVASLLVHHHIPVHCKLPVGSEWPRYVDGMTFYDPDEIYLRYCPLTRRQRSYSVIVFAHELIHIEHPHWPHWKVYKWDDWYARVVVGPAISRRLNESLC
jgi:hypothetical protein